MTAADADPDSDQAPPRLFLSRYAQTRKQGPTLPGRSQKPTIAVVTVAGPIVSGRGGPQAFPLSRSSAGADTIAAALREAAADDDVKAVVVRVESPGGSVNGSETIWREVCRIRAAGKPVVASMGAVAASGGYYVSMSADAIVASPGTITGSIGVVTGKLVTRELKERLGVGSDSVRTNANADAWSGNSPFTPEQHATGRGRGGSVLRRLRRPGRRRPRAMTVEQVDAVARGRVWTGVGRAGARSGRRTRRSAHRGAPGQGAGRAGCRRRGSAGRLSQFVGARLLAAQGFFATRGGVVIRCCDHSAGRCGHRLARPPAGRRC